MLSISPQLAQYVREDAEIVGLHFDLLVDARNAVARQFGLVFRLPDDMYRWYQEFGLDLEQQNGDDSHELPMPGSFVIDGDGVIRFASADPDYTVRPEPAELLRVVQSLT